jgi:hypothetical protein
MMQGTFNELVKKTDQSHTDRNPIS